MTELEQMLLETANESKKEERRYLGLRLTAVRLNYPVLTKLKELGFITDFNLWSCRYPNDIKVEVKDLPTLKKNFETFKVEDSYVLHNSRDATIRVYIDLGGNRSFVYYVKALPADSRCKIVTTTSMNSELVCSMNE